MSARAPLRLAILISGRGSNLAAIAHACRERRIAAEIAVVLSERPEAQGLTVARELGLDARAIAWPGTARRAEFERAAAAVLEETGAQLIVLAGFMRILSGSFVAARHGAILNIHPSLLPKYPGLHTHRRALDARDRVHGATVHFVTEELDGGPRVLQAKVPVLRDDTEQSLCARVQSAEHIIYPRVIGWRAEGRLLWRAGSPWLDGRPLLQPLVETFDA